MGNKNKDTSAEETQTESTEVETTEAQQDSVESSESSDQQSEAATETVSAAVSDIPNNTTAAQEEPTIEPDGAREATSDEREALLAKRNKQN